LATSTGLGGATLTGLGAGGAACETGLGVLVTLGGAVLAGAVNAAVETFLGVLVAGLGGGA